MIGPQPQPQDRDGEEARSPAAGWRTAGRHPEPQPPAAVVVRPIALGTRRRPRPDHAAPFDEVLVSAKAGFPWAFEHLFGALSRPLLSYFRTQGATDPAGSANDVLLRAYRAIDRFEGGEGQFRSWVFTIARNSLIDERRRLRRRVSTQALDESLDVRSSEPDTEDSAMHRLGSQRAVDIIQSLVPDQREVLMLRIVGDLTIEQIATVVGKRPGAVKALQRRGLAAIRRTIDLGDVPE